MGQIKLDIYTFQMKPVPNLQLGLFDSDLTPESIMKRKNLILKESLHNSKLNFRHRGHTLNYKIEYQDDEFSLFRIANRKKISLEQSFKRETFSSEPSCLVGIYNNPEFQYVLIESDKTSFGSSQTVARLLNSALKRELKSMNLSLSINPTIEETEIWKLIQRHQGAVERIKFELQYPNLPRVTKLLNDELKEAAKSLNSGTTKLEFDAPEDTPLQNLDENNKQLNSLVKASAEGAGPIRIKVKGLRAWKGTDKKVKSKEVDELEVDLPPDGKVDYVEMLKAILRDE